MLLCAEWGLSSVYKETACAPSLELYQCLARDGSLVATSGINWPPLTHSLLTGITHVGSSCHLGCWTKNVLMDSRVLLFTLKY